MQNREADAKADEGKAAPVDATNVDVAPAMLIMDAEGDESTPIVLQGQSKVARVCSALHNKLQACRLKEKLHCALLVHLVVS